MFEENFKNNEDNKEQDKDDNNITRRDFIKGAGASLALGAISPEIAFGENNIENSEEKHFLKTKRYLEMAEEFFLEGKRINLQPIKKELEILKEMSFTKYNSYVELLEGVGETYFSIDQMRDFLSDSVENILNAIENGKTGLEEHIYKLEDLKVGRKRPYQEIVKMAQVYSLSSSRGQREYGINFVKLRDGGSKELVTITEALHGQSQSVGLDISDELKYGPDYEIFSLHTHPNKFSFFSIRGDLTYYLSNADSVEYLRNFTAQMVDKSAITCSMKFSKMTQEQLNNLKVQDMHYTTFLVENIDLLNELVTDYEKNGLTQFLLIDSFRDDIKERIIKIINQIDTRTHLSEEEQEMKKIKLELESLLTEIKKLPENIKDLTSLQNVAMGILGSEEKEDFIKNTLKVKEEFQKHGIEIFPVVPGRIKKKWNKN
jgi:hypothetical protein